MAAPVVQFKQRNNLTKLELKLHPDYAEHYVVDGRGKVSGFNVKYELLPKEFYYRTYRPNDMFVKFPLSLTAVMTLGELYEHPSADAYLTIGFMIFSGLVLCGIGYGLRRLLNREYTALATATGTLLIVKDRQHDQIVRELQARRSAALRRQVVVDRLVPPWNELKKFKWLRDEGIISDDDFKSYRELILSSTDVGAGAPVKNSILH